MTSQSDDHIAEELIARMDAAGREALRIIGAELKARVIADIPRGDPTLDPDPSYALADHITVRVYKRSMTVAVHGAYVIKQHESIYLRHVRGGHSKFLERQAVSVAKDFQGLLSGSVKRKFVEGGRAGRVRTSTSSIDASGVGDANWTGG